MPVTSSFNLINKYSCNWPSSTEHHLKTFPMVDTRQSYCFSKYHFLECCFSLVWFPINELPFAVGFAKSFVTKRKSSAVFMPWLTSSYSTSLVCSAAHAWRNVSSKLLLANAEASACRMRPFNNFDAEIQLMSSINLRKILPHLAHLGKRYTLESRDGSPL